MLAVILWLVFISVLMLVFSAVPLSSVETRPTLQSFLTHEGLAQPKKKAVSIFRFIALINKPLCIGPLGKRISRDIATARVNMTAEEFLLLKEILIGATLMALSFLAKQPDMRFFWIAVSFTFGYMLPEFWLKKKVKKVKDAIIRELPDVIDLLGLCVNAGLDFMLALKWVIEKSKASVLVEEMNLLMQEINVGKTRRTALTDLAKKYELADLSTFTRTLIQTDRMGTSVAEALNILSEDMRVSRYRRGERVALKAPMKMLIPLLVFIFPVVAILVAAPVFLDFMHNNPMSQIAGGIGPQGASPIPGVK